MDKRAFMCCVLFTETKTIVEHEIFERNCTKPQLPNVEMRDIKYFLCMDVLFSVFVIINIGYWNILLKQSASWEKKTFFLINSIVMERWQCLFYDLMCRFFRTARIVIVTSFDTDFGFFSHIYDTYYWSKSLTYAILIPS